MTRRGQVTLASLGLAFVLALGWLVEPFGAVRAALNPELDVAGVGQRHPHRHGVILDPT